MWLTNHIVAILILHHKLQGAGTITVQRSQLGNNGLSLFICAELDALLNDV